jgi:hypothetical protein
MESKISVRAVIHRPPALPILACALVVLSASRGPGEEVEKRWPREFRARAAKVVPMEAPAGTTAAYQTAHFRLYSDDPVGKEDLQQFASVIESVPQLLRRLPLPLWAPPGAKKPVVRLCRNEERFEEAGGPRSSTGYYSGRKQEILIRADIFLNPPRARPSRLQPKPNEDLLVHELTHLGMHGVVAKSPPWFYEGMAEYMAAGHQAGGNYSFHNIDSTIRDHIRNYLPPGKDGSIPFPALGPLMTLNGKQWIDANKRSEGEDAYRPYAAALLLVHYHLHGKTRREKLRRYLEELAAYKDFRKPRPRLATGPPDEIQERLHRYWFPKGLNLRFVKPEGLDGMR